MENRIKYFDIAKFIGLMMIILGHFGVPDINDYVYTFHIPLFFIISGYFFHPRDNNLLFFKQKFRQLIIPYFFVMGIVIGINFIINLYQSKDLYLIGSEILDYIIGYIYGSGYNSKILGYEIKTVGPIWFLVALFWDYVILNLIIRKNQLNLILVCLFTIGYLSAQYLWLPFDIQASMTSIFFVYIGYLLKKKNILEKEINLVSILPLLCIWGIGISYKGSFLFVTNTATFLIPDIIISFVASYLVLLYCQWLEKNVKNLKMILFFGQYTLIMLCFHSIDINIMPWNSFYSKDNTTIYIVLMKLLLTIFKFIFPMLGVLLVLKVKILRKIFSIKN